MSSLTFNEKLTKDFQIAIEQNQQVNIFIPSATMAITGTPVEIDEFTLTLAIGGGMRGGVLKTVIDLEAINAYTINAQ